MTDLSPAAQAVLNAYRTLYAKTLRPGPFVDNWQEVCAAAALRAAADGCDPDWLALTVLHHLHSIADELEAQ
jgi:hypothetical protein